MATVSIEFSAFMDPRYRVLADLSEQSRFDAIGRMALIWAYCIEKNQSVLPAVLIDAMAEIRGYAGSVIEAGLGDAQPDDKVRIKGTQGRIEWLEEARARQKVATEAAKRKRLSSTSPKMNPNLDPNLGPALDSSSASASASASSSKDLNTIVRRKHRTEYSEDFEKLYHQYPRKEGKAGAFRIFQKLDQNQRNSLVGAVANYLEQCRSEGRELRYIKQFSAFMTNWTDYIDSNLQKGHALGVAAPLCFGVDLS